MTFAVATVGLLSVAAPAVVGAGAGDSPSIDLVKSADVATVDAVGDFVTYRYVATNSGDVALTDVTITDPQPGLTALVCDRTAPVTLDPGQTVTCEAIRTAAQDDFDAGQIVNVGTARGMPPSGPEVSDTASVTVAAHQVEGIALTKTASPTSAKAVGDVITYTYTATNNGNVTLTSVSVTDPQPGLSALSCTPSAPTTLAPGQGLTCTATRAVTQDDFDRGSVTNSATAQGVPPDNSVLIALASATVTTAATPDVTAVANRPPIAADDIATVRPGATATIDPRGNDSDPDAGAVLGLPTISSPPSSGTATVGADGIVTYVAPARVVSGTVVTIGYSVCDQAGACATATIRITISSGGGQLPATGSTTATLTLLALAACLVVAGVVARRARSA